MESNKPPLIGIYRLIVTRLNKGETAYSFFLEDERIRAKKI